MFRRRPLGDELAVALTEPEAELLRRMVGEYVAYLDSSSPDDEVRTRLFPPASLEDEQVAQEFRELAAGDLQLSKRRGAEQAQEFLGSSGAKHGVLGEDEQQAWLVLLTDLRLVLGTRLGVTEETMETVPDPADPTQLPLAVLHYLGALQESLVRALDPEAAS
jgi:hypothetical protein